MTADRFAAGGERAAGAAVAADRRRRALEELVASTREAIDALAAADGETASRLSRIDARRRDILLALDPVGDRAADDPGCEALARQALILDARLLRDASRARDALGAKVRDLHAVARAQRGYAGTDTLAAGASRP